MFKNFKDNILTTCFIFLVFWLLSFISVSIEILNPIEDIFGDFELTDIVYSGKSFRDELQEDTNVVVINIGNLSRAEIAEEIRIINQHKPKVIGIDSFFRRPKSADGDSLLAKALSEVENLVMVTKLHYNESTRTFDSLETSNPMFVKYAQPAYANLITEGYDNFRTARVFSPYDTLNSAIQTFFAVKLAGIYNPAALHNLAQRQKDIEIINYRGNIFGEKRKFFALDVPDIFEGNFDPSLIHDKIVLLGYLDNQIPLTEHTWGDDKFFTPLNDKYVGKAYPDMFGVVVHANIISMILHNSYIDTSPNWINFLIGFLMCFVSVTVFHLVLQLYPQLFDPITKVFQLLFIVLIDFAIIYLFNVYSVKVDFTLAIVAVALAPDLLEIYLHLVKAFVTFLRKSIYIWVAKIKSPYT